MNDKYDTAYDAACDAEMDYFYDRVSKDRMQSYFMENPTIISPAIQSSENAAHLFKVSPSSALVMLTTSIEIHLKSVLLKPMLYGMIHNAKVAETIVDLCLQQSGFARYNDLLIEFCDIAGGIDLKPNKDMQKSILGESVDVYKIRNKVLHQGYKVTEKELEKAKNIADRVLSEVVKPVLNNLGFVVKSNESGWFLCRKESIFNSHNPTQ